MRWGWATLLPNLLLLGGRLLLRGVSLLLLVLGALAALLVRVGAWLVWPLRKLFELAWGAAERAYPALLGSALSHPLLVIVLVVALGWLAARRIPHLGVELLPEIHQGEFTAHVGLGVESPLENTDAVLRAIDRDVRALDGVAVTALTVGVEADTLSREIEGEHTARLTVRLDPAARGYEREDAVLAHVRELFESHPEVRTLDVTRPTPFALESPVAVEVYGHDLDEMGEVAARVETRMRRVPGLTDVRSTIRPGHPEARVVFDREKTLEYGLDLATVSALVRDQVLGSVPTRFVEGEERIDVRVQGDERYVTGIDDVLELAVNPEADTSVPLDSVARVRLERGPAEIRRIGNSRAAVLTASSAGLDLGGLNRRIAEELADLETGDDVYVELGGQKRELEEGMASMRFALLLAIFLVYVVMASQFESLLQPLVIMLTVPLAGVGVIFALDLLGVTLSVVVFIGLILLAGIVVNNAIVLVDRINKKRDEGLDLREATMEAGRARLRPILMTTLTTALGLLPLTGWLASVPVIGALGAGEGAEIRAPMAITVIAGLVSSTLLTLVVVPVVYSLVARRRRGAAGAEVAA